MARTATPELKTTLSPSKIDRRRNAKAKGFTLIEVLIVLAIISFVMALALPAIDRVTYQRINSTTRKFVGLVRTIRNDAILLNTVHRLAIDFDHKVYWVEYQKEFQLLGTVAATTTKKKGKSSLGESDEAQSNFVMADKFSKKPIPMPQGIIFEGVLKEREGLKKEGVVYINFFPNGFNDAAILYLMRDSTKSFGYSILMRPTLGRVEIFTQKLTNFDGVVEGESHGK